MEYSEAFLHCRLWSVVEKQFPQTRPFSQCRCSSRETTKFSRPLTPGTTSARHQSSTRLVSSTTRIIARRSWYHSSRQISVTPTCADMGATWRVSGRGKVALLPGIFNCSSQVGVLSSIEIYQLLSSHLKKEISVFSKKINSCLQQFSITFKSVYRRFLWEAVATVTVWRRI